MNPTIHLGVNLNFAKYVWSARAALDIAADDLGLKVVEPVADNDFGPALFLSEPQAFLDHHAEIAQHANERGIRLPTVFTFYRDAGGVASPNPAIRRAARSVLSSIAHQAAIYGSQYACAALMTAARDEFAGAGSHSLQWALDAWCDWMREAKELGLRGLIVEMSAQPREACESIYSSLRLLEQLNEYHLASPGCTVPVELCYDLGHGMSREENADSTDRDFKCWFSALAPHIREIHLKNTDADFLTTWPFTEEYRARGIINAAAVVERASALLSGDLYLMLEIAGKRGRELGERTILRELQESVSVWKEALYAAAYSEQADGSRTCAGGEDR